MQILKCSSPFHLLDVLLAPPSPLFQIQIQSQSNSDSHNLLLNVMDIIESTPSPPPNFSVSSFLDLLLNILRSDQLLLETICAKVAGDHVLNRLLIGVEVGEEDGNDMSSDDEASSTPLPPPPTATTNVSSSR